MREFVSILLAAGQGVRMESPLPKVLHPVKGRPLIKYALDPILQVRPLRNIVVVGYGRGEVIRVLEGYPVEFAVQDVQKGTGHAVSEAGRLLADYTGTVLVLPGDVPLLTVSTLKKLMKFHMDGSYAATVLTGDVENPFGYGRVVRDKQGDLVKIVEERDAGVSEKRLHEINSGIYCFEYPPLREALAELKNENDQGEYYLTDTIAILRAKGLRIGVLKGNSEEILGVNTVLELKAVEKKIMKSPREEN
ncbi:MAG: NTP transferase domain-containing protein [Candidatus Eisenbacteria bacterium]|nr:NTP transferase domain-containing protein [Candidatus Eisenbacteria bacterium]